MRLTLTKEAEYALRALVWLSAAEETARAAGLPGRQKAAAISSAAHIPPVFTARVLAQLRRQGLLWARAGQHGGYTLAHPAGAISLLRVIEAVEGPLQTRTCVLRNGACGAGGTCLLHDAWSTAQDALRSALAATTLATLRRAGPNPPGPGAGDALSLTLDRAPAAPTRVPAGSSPIVSPSAVGQCNARTGT
jgi:Rrf2 family protein